MHLTYKRKSVQWTFYDPDCSITVYKNKEAFLRIVVGIHSCLEALKVRTEKEIQKVFLKPEWQRSSSLSKLALLSKTKGVRPEVQSLKKFNRLADNHQGVCVYVSGEPQWDWNNTKEQLTVIVLDGIEDPKNLGAIVRTSWLMGVDGVFISHHRSVSLTPSVMKSASGGVEHIPICIENLKNILKLLKEKGFWVYALNNSSEHSLWKEKFEGRMAFVFGGEHSGLKPGLQKICDKQLSIPQVTKNASYNVSVAAGIVLSECQRQQ